MSLGSFGMDKVLANSLAIPEPVKLWGLDPLFLSGVFCNTKSFHINSNYFFLYENKPKIKIKSWNKEKNSN